MDERLLDEELEVACDAARAAWQRIVPYYGGMYRIDEKEDGPSTQADREASEAIIHYLSQRLPGYGILSEEAEDDLRRLDRKRVWVIDPIDGTNDFIDRTGFFAIQVALVVRRGDAFIPVVGVVYHATEGRMYRARLGGGAWVEKSGEGHKPLHVSLTDRIEEMTVVVSRSHRTPSNQRILDGLAPRETITMGSMGLKMAWIAEGRADYYVNDARGKCKEWDLCAPGILLTEAGGRVTDFSEEIFRYNRRDVRFHEGILASNGACHAALCRRVRELDRQNSRDLGVAS